jgi:hypothetical protein
MKQVAGMLKKKQDKGIISVGYVRFEQDRLGGNGLGKRDGHDQII